MTDRPCSSCKHYDVIRRGEKPTKIGWCAKLSKYPSEDSVGQQTPPGVTRVAPGLPAVPYLVKGALPKPGCVHYIALPLKK